MIRSVNLEIEVTEDSKLDEIFFLLKKILENIETNWSVRITCGSIVYVF
jgi:hypothetical protein